MSTVTIYKSTSYSLFPHAGNANLQPMEPSEYELPEGYYVGRTRLGSKVIFRNDQLYACSIVPDETTGEPVLVSHQERHILKRSAK